MQKAADLSNPRVYHSADSKSEIVVVFDTKDTKMAKDFAASVDGGGWCRGHANDLFSRIDRLSEWQNAP